MKQLLLSVLLVIGASACQKTDENYSKFDKEMIDHYHKKWGVFQKRLERIPAGNVKPDELQLHKAMINVLDNSSSANEVMKKLGDGDAFLAHWVNNDPDGLSSLVLTMITRLDSIDYILYKTRWHFNEIHPIVYTIQKKDSTEVKVYLGASENIVPNVRLMDVISGYEYHAQWTTDNNGMLINSITVGNKDLKRLKGIMMYPDHKGKDVQIPFNLK